MKTTAVVSTIPTETKAETRRNYNTAGASLRAYTSEALVHRKLAPRGLLCLYVVRVNRRATKRHTGFSPSTYHSSKVVGPKP